MLIDISGARHIGKRSRNGKTLTVSSTNKEHVTRIWLEICYLTKRAAIRIIASSINVIRG